MKKIKTPILKTERLILRPVELEDAPALQRHFNNWNIIKQLNDLVPWPYPEDGTYSFLKDNMLPRVTDGSAHAWCIELNQDIIGFIEYRNDPNDPLENRGFWLAEPYWKQGYISEAVTIVNDFVFNELKVNKMSLTNFIGNDGSHRVKEKTGATYIKTITEGWRGGERKKELWELTADNWKKFRE